MATVALVANTVYRRIRARVLSEYLEIAVGLNRELREPREKKEPERNLSSPKDLTYSRSY